MNQDTLTRWIAVAALAAAGGCAPALAATPAELLAQYSAQATDTVSAEKGQALFTSRHADNLGCLSCHGAQPTGTGRHVVTSRPIAPLAPAFNPERFTNAAKVEKWFRRNCNDVLGRECSAAEKADVLTWLISLKP